MRVLMTVCLCLAWTTARAQSVHYKIGVDTNYLSQFTVQKATDSNVHPIGIRLLASNYDYLPVEFGLHAYAGYGNVARASFGLSLAYAFANVKSNHFKIGLSLDKIDLKDAEVNKSELGPHVGDVQFTRLGTQFKPYIEWEWGFSHFSSLFIHAGYRTINAEKVVTTAVEGEGLHRRVTKTGDETFFYSASGVEFGIGLSIDFSRGK